MAKFKVKPLVQETAETFRVGTKDAPLKDADRKKLVSLGEDGSQVVLGAADGEIFGYLSSVEGGATVDGYKIGGVIPTGYALVDTGELEVGDLVVIDSNPASGTPGLTKVKKAPADVTYKWQVVDTGVIRKV